MTYWCLLCHCVVLKDKGKGLKGPISKDLVPDGFDARIEEIQEEL